MIGITAVRWSSQISRWQLEQLVSLLDPETQEQNSCDVIRQRPLPHRNKNCLCFCQSLMEPHGLSNFRDFVHRVSSTRCFCERILQPSCWCQTTRKRSPCFRPLFFFIALKATRPSKSMVGETLTYQEEDRVWMKAHPLSDTPKGPRHQTGPMGPYWSVSHWGASGSSELPYCVWGYRSGSAGGQRLLSKGVLPTGAEVEAQEREAVIYFYRCWW